MTVTEAERQAFKKSGALGGKTAARNMSARARRERAMKAVNSPKSIYQCDQNCGFVERAPKKVIREYVVE